MTDEQKRSSIDGMDGEPTVAKGVGGRRQGSPPAVWGGGYLDICSQSVASVEATQKKSRTACGDDQRLAELRRIGISAKWMAVAEVIGYDAFIAMALVLQPGRHYAPPLDAIVRDNRNKYIRALAAGGAKPAEIKRTLNRKGEEISLMQITRIISRGGPSGGAH